MSTGGMQRGENMKKLLSLLFALSIVIALCACGGSAPSQSQPSSTPLPQATPDPTPDPETLAREERIKHAEMVNAALDREKASAYGIDVEKGYSAFPESDEEHFNNFLIAYLNGDWEFLPEAPDSVEWNGDLYSNCVPYSALLGAFINQSRFHAICADGNYYIVTENNEPAFNEAELKEQTDKAYEKAVELVEGLKAVDGILPHYPELDICNACSRFLHSYGVRMSGANYALKTPQERVLYMEYDSAYACLVNKTADCGGRSAGFNLLAGVAGVHCYSIRGQIPGTGSGHIVSYFVTGGEEYLNDFWAIKVCDKMQSPTMAQHFIPEQLSLSQTKRAMGIKDITASFRVTNITETDEFMVVDCYVDSSYEEETETTYAVCYGVWGNYVFHKDLTLDELKQGVQIEFYKSVIEEFSIPQIIFIQEGYTGPEHSPF